MKYIPLSSSNFIEEVINEVGDSNGTYVLHLFESGQSKSIGRLFGIDLSGILYIGKSEGPILNRVKSLKRSIDLNLQKGLIKPKEGGHKMLSKRVFRIRRWLHIDQLVVSLYPTIESPSYDESFMIEEYVSKFGELPPLNGNHGVIEFWKLFE